MNEYIKVSDTELKIIKEEVKQTEHTYNLVYLKAQREAILKQKAEQMAQRDKELAFVDELIAKCIELEIKEIKEDKEEIIEPIKE